MEENLNSKLEKLKREVWSVTKNLSAQIEEIVNSSGSSSSEDLEQALEDIENLKTSLNSLSSSVSTNSNSITNLLQNKVDKESGKTLSSNDFTTQEKQKLAGIADNANNYVLPSNVATISDIPTTLASLSDDSTHRLTTDTEKTLWNSKQNSLTFDNAPTANSSNPVTSDGIKTALDSKLDSTSLADVATSGNYDDLINKPFSSFSYSNGVLTITI